MSANDSEVDDEMGCGELNTRNLADSVRYFTQDHPMLKRVLCDMHKDPR